MSNFLCDKASNILIVDDDKSVRGFLEKFLKLKGCQRIKSAATGQDALRIIGQEGFKLVLLDIQLPDMGGLEVLRQIRQMNKDIPVIMITGFPDESKAREMIKEGAYDYIIKPFDLDYLELSVLTKIF